MIHWFLIALAFVVGFFAVGFLLIWFWVLGDPPKDKRPRLPLQQLPWPPPHYSAGAELSAQKVLPDQNTSELLQKIAGLVPDLHKPAILVRATMEPARSNFGGAPSVKLGFEWPRNKGLPMACIACVDLSELPADHGLDFLPTEGTLSFFVDQENPCGGYSITDRDWFRVVYHSASDLPFARAAFPDDLISEYRFAQRHMKFVKENLPRDWEMKEMIGVFETDEQQDAFCDHRQSLYRGLPAHQIGGYVQAIQTPEMEMECQMLIHGIRVDSREFRSDPKYAELESGVAEWRLLFQFDHDPYQRIHPGEPGTHYFWVRRDDALAGNFNRCWLIFQCT